MQENNVWMMFNRCSQTWSPKVRFTTKSSTNCLTNSREPSSVHYLITSTPPRFHSCLHTPTLFANKACSVVKVSPSEVVYLHLVLQQINMILSYPQCCVTWSIPCHYDSYELWPPCNGIIPHVHYRRCVGCLECYLLCTLWLHLCAPSFHRPPFQWKTVYVLA